MQIAIWNNQAISVLTYSGLCIIVSVMFLSWPYASRQFHSEKSSSLKISYFEASLHRNCVIRELEVFDTDKLAREAKPMEIVCQLPIRKHQTLSILAVLRGRHGLMWLAARGALACLLLEPRCSRVCADSGVHYGAAHASIATLSWE